MTTRKTNRKSPVSAVAPASVAPAPASLPPVLPASTKYTRGLSERGARLSGLETASVADFAAVRLNEKAIFPGSGTFHATFTPKTRSTSFAYAVWNALRNREYKDAIAHAVIAATEQPGAVPVQYTVSYRLVTSWLKGEGSHPGMTHVVNVAKHLAGYINGYMLKANKGGMHLS